MSVAEPIGTVVVEADGNEDEVEYSRKRSQLVAPVERFSSVHATSTAETPASPAAAAVRTGAAASGRQTTSSSQAQSEPLSMLPSFR